MSQPELTQPEQLTQPPELAPVAKKTDHPVLWRAVSKSVLGLLAAFGATFMPSGNQPVEHPPASPTTPNPDFKPPVVALPTESNQALISKLIQELNGKGVYDIVNIQAYPSKIDIKWQLTPQDVYALPDQKLAQPRGVQKFAESTKGLPLGGNRNQGLGTIEISLPANSKSGLFTITRRTDPYNSGQTREETWLFANLNPSESLTIKNTDSSLTIQSDPGSFATLLSWQHDNQTKIVGQIVEAKP